MDKKDALERLEEIFRDLLDDEEFVLAEDLAKDDIAEWDSLFHVTLIATISDEFNMEFTTDDMLAATSIPAVLDILEKGAKD